jgi:hypothetical protein
MNAWPLSIEDHGDSGRFFSDDPCSRQLFLLTAAPFLVRSKADGDNASWSRES